MNWKSTLNDEAVIMWSIIFLAQLGADGHDPRIRRACNHLH